MGSERNDVIDGFSTIVNPAAAPAHDSFIEKKSEFIGDACHIKTLDEALAFVQTVRDQNPKARHVAFAAIFGAAQGSAKERMSDDGEPSGTAGKPILDVIRMGRLTDCVVTVTRYFGGILLGSGGLIRAYSTAASMAVKAADIERIVPMQRYRIILEYPWLGRFEQLLEQVGGKEESREFTDRITMRLAVPSANAEDFETRVREAFNAQARLLRL
ncbi:YigZ family protein [Bifidobacterium sp. ESL0764]|uniref:IMPACT family protein n=1 Tax=Bifidobacterium sp. ESL0764 TaxID=2983228 RepID=UPI0023F820B3|nr:YigZ family protein [Bifidobacterium sp. ESL0764]WEV65482.1 IMPACT family protein [Bifidobacterium sp. ESL0764]